MENIRERVKKTDWYSFDKHENIVYGVHPDAKSVFGRAQILDYYYIIISNKY